MSYTSELLDKYKNGTDPNTDRMLYRLKLIFNSLVVNLSLDKGYVDDKDLVLSGGGSFLHNHRDIFSLFLDLSHIFFQAQHNLA